MYKIIRNNKRFNNKVFVSYVAARRYIRGWAVDHGLTNTARSVILADYGFSITKA